MMGNVEVRSVNAKEAVAKRISELCAEQDLAVNALANSAGMSPSTIYSMLNNKSKNPGIVTIKQICDGKTKDNYTCYLIPVDDVIMEEDDSKGTDENMITGIELDVEEEVVSSEKQTRGMKGFFRKLWNLKDRK